MGSASPELPPRLLLPAAAPACKAVGRPWMGSLPRRGLAAPLEAAAASYASCCSCHRTDSPCGWPPPPPPDATLSCSQGEVMPRSLSMPPAVVWVTLRRRPSCNTSARMHIQYQRRVGACHVSWGGWPARVSRLSEQTTCAANACPSPLLAAPPPLGRHGSVPLPGHIHPPGTRLGPGPGPGPHPHASWPEG